MSKGSHVHRRNTSAGHDCIEPLEARRLLSLSVAGPEEVAAGMGGSKFDLAVAGDGTFMIVGTRTVDGRSMLTAIRYAPSGEQLGDPIEIDSPPGGFDGPSVAMDADGDAVVAYQRSQSDVYVARISRTGALSTPVPVGTAGPEELLGKPGVSMDAAGGFFVAHIGDLQVAPYLQPLRVRAFDAAGTPRAAEFQAANGVSNFTSLDSIDIAALPDGSGAILTARFSGEHAPYVRAIRVSTSAVVREEPRVGSSTHTHDVAAHTDGSFVTGFTSGGSGWNPDMSRVDAFARRFGAAGLPPPPAILLEAEPWNSFSVSVDVTPDGGFIAGFIQDGPFGVATAYARRYNPTGAPDPSGPVALGTGALGDVVAGVDDRGGAVVAYRERGDTAVYFRRLSASAARVERGELYVDGSEAADHIIVERVRDRLYVNINGVVERFRAADVRFVSINGFGGDDDIINATDLQATIHGGDGFDTIWGGTHADRILGFGGNDFLRGGDGGDTIFGGNGNDSLSGGGHNDDLSGDAGEDALYGSTGEDFLRGHRGSDRLYGEADDDTLDGGDAGDYLEGGAGHDQLTGGGGADAMFGLGGNDNFVNALDGSADTVRGGPGTDNAEPEEIDDISAVERVIQVSPR